MSTSADDVQVLIIEVLETFFALRRAGQGQGLVTERGQGYWGMLRLLDEHGPMTVPQIAELRGLTRQRMQVLANRLAEDGMLTFEANPAHKRSRLLVLTSLGQAQYRAMTRRLHDVCEALAAQLPDASVAEAARTMRQLRDALGS